MIEAKPAIVDFGPDPSTKVVKIGTSHANLYITDMPAWLQSLTLPYNISITSNLGSLSLTPRIDTLEYYTPEYITIVDNVAAPTETFYLPVMWSQDSQKILIRDIVDDFLVNLDEDNYAFGLQRPTAMNYAKRGLQQMHYSGLQEVRYHEAVVNDVDQVSLPVDALEFIRVFAVTDDGYLVPMYVNEKINISESYIRDVDGFLILDSEGHMVSGSGLTPTIQNPLSSSSHNLNYNYPENVFSGMSFKEGRLFGIRGGHSNFFGEYKYDPSTKKFTFDNLATDNVVIEYISDPLLDEKISRKYGGLRIHKYFREALDHWIYWQAIERRKSVPAIEKRRARQEYFIQLKKARRYKGASKIGELVQALRSDRGFNRGM